MAAKEKRIAVNSGLPTLKIDPAPLCNDYLMKSVKVLGRKNSGKHSFSQKPNYISSRKCANWNNNSVIYSLVPLADPPSFYLPFKHLIGNLIDFIQLKVMRHQLIELQVFGHRHIHISRNINMGGNTPI